MEFEQIYNTYFKRVYLYIRKLSGNDHIAEEITCETFFKAMQSIDGFRGECNFSVWLCQIAKNTYYSYLKKQTKISNIKTSELEEIIDPRSLIDEKLITDEQTVQVQKILHNMPEPYKEVFMWRVFADLSFKEIGQIFNKTDNWACVTYHRAKIQILKQVEDQNNEN